MGNEMGNNNSGSQEQDKTDAEEPNKSQDFHEKDTGLNSGEPSGVSDPLIGKEASDIKVLEPDKTNVEQSDGKLEAPVVTKHTDSASEKSPSDTGDNQVREETSTGKESITPDKESMESVSQPAEPSVEGGKKLQGSNEDILGSNDSRVSEKSEEKLNDISATEAAKNRADTLTENEMESQKSKNDGHITETSAVVMVGKTSTLLDDAEKGDKEPQVVGVDSFRKDAKELKINVVPSMESVQVKASKYDTKHSSGDIKVVENGAEISASPIASNTKIETEKLLDKVDSNMALGTPKDNGSSNTGLSQEDLSTKVDVKAGSSFHAEKEIANTDPVMSSQKLDSGNNPLLHQTVSVEAKQSAEGLTTEPKAEHLKINAKVNEVSSYNLPLLHARNSESDRTPLLNQEKISKNVANVRNQIAETEFVVPEPEERSVEKQVIAERTSTEKMKAPLLNFMKEENHVIGPPKKQEGIVANEESIPPERKKQKPKYSLFSNCMCCTAVTQ